MSLNLQENITLFDFNVQEVTTVSLKLKGELEEDLLDNWLQVKLLKICTLMLGLVSPIFPLQTSEASRFHAVEA